MFFPMEIKHGKVESSMVDQSVAPCRSLKLTHAAGRLRGSRTASKPGKPEAGKTQLLHIILGIGWYWTSGFPQPTS
jgi:hypothetical protein